jgi:hypothetical protein
MTLARIKARSTFEVPWRSRTLFQNTSPYRPVPSAAKYLLKARVIIASYNDHCSAPSSRAFFGWFQHHQSLLGSREPTLSWNQLRSQPASQHSSLPPPTLALASRCTRTGAVSAKEGSFGVRCSLSPPIPSYASIEFVNKMRNSSPAR